MLNLVLFFTRKWMSRYLASSCTRILCSRISYKGLDLCQPRILKVTTPSLNMSIDYPTIDVSGKITAKRVLFSSYSVFSHVNISKNGDIFQS